MDALVESGGGDEGLPGEVHELPVHPVPHPLVDFLGSKDEWMIRCLEDDCIK